MLARCITLGNRNTDSNIFVKQLKKLAHQEIKIACGFEDVAVVEF